MATTLQPPTTVQFPASGSARRTKVFDPGTSSIGIWIALAAITMTFAAFTSAMVVRQGSANDWHHFSFPTILYFNTLVLLASSFTLQISRQRFSVGLSRSDAGMKLALPTMYLTLALGGLLVAGQYVAWYQLRAQGVYLASAPSSSFFYVFTVL